MDLKNLLDLNNLKNLNPKLVALIGGGIALVLVGIIFLFYLRLGQNAKTNPPSQKATQEEVKKLIAEVDKLIDLPIGEDPTVATVTDVSKLQGQAFFQKAKNGDKVLIYTNAGKAILYDPQAKKVIDIAPINVGSQSAALASPTPTSRPRPSSTPTSNPTATP